MAEEWQEDRQRKLEQIQALLAQAESTDFPEEAKTFSAKAQELMTRYAVDQAMLEALGKKFAPDKVVHYDVQVNGPHEVEKITLLYVIATVNGVMAVRSPKYESAWRGHIQSVERVTKRIDDNPKARGSFRVLHLTGFERDIEATLDLYTSLTVQMTREMLTVGCPAYENKGTWTAHFIRGYAVGIQGRLVAARQAVRAQAAKDFVAAGGGNLLPVLASKEAQVKSEFEERWGGRLGRGRSSYIRGGSGYASGKAAAGRADTGQPGVGSQKALGR